MLELLLAFIGSLCAGVLFNIKRSKLLWNGLAGMVGWLAFAWLFRLTGETILATFAGALAVGIFSECMARVLRAPATVFSISGIFPLVPGIGAYNTVRYLVEGKLQEAYGRAVETMASAGAIAFGIILVTGAFRFARKLWEKDA